MQDVAQHLHADKHISTEGYAFHTSYCLLGHAKLLVKLLPNICARLCGRFSGVWGARSGGKDTEALAGSQRLGKKVRVVRKVKGPNPTQTISSQDQYVYIYCGQYEVQPRPGIICNMLTSMLQ